MEHNKDGKRQEDTEVIADTAARSRHDATLNSSGHAQELSRNFSPLTLAGLGLVSGSVWPALGGSILVAIFNGGPPGKCHYPCHQAELLTRLY
jgi:choline transport protein